MAHIHALKKNGQHYVWGIMKYKLLYIDYEVKDYITLFRYKEYS